MTRNKKPLGAKAGELGRQGAEKSRSHYTPFPFFSQVRRLAKSFIICLALWGVIPWSWADKLVGGLRHD